MFMTGIVVHVFVSMTNIVKMVNTQNNVNT